MLWRIAIATFVAFGSRTGVVCTGLPSYSYFDELAHTPEALEKYVGEYEVNENYRVKIFRNGNQLFIQRNSQSAIELFNYNENTFFQKDDVIRVAFEQQNGLINKILIFEGLNTKKGDKMKK